MMIPAKTTGSTVRSVLGILLAAALLITAQPIPAYAADNNPEGQTLDTFPTGISSDTMDENAGSIYTLKSSGTVKDNRGNISHSGGNVYLNHGSIEALEAGHVGTNYGTIQLVTNTGSLGVNDGSGEVLFVAAGNVVDRNDGTIRENVGIVSENFGTVDDNYGTVTMRDGRIGSNFAGGTVKFIVKESGGAAIPAKGTVNYNAGSVEVGSGTVTIKENAGRIEIKNATVTVEKNSGSITVGENAALICGENGSDGAITKTSADAVVTCTSNEGTVRDETARKWKIVFTGDDGQAAVIECDEEADGAYYTEYEGAVLFTLPPEYGCESAIRWEPEGSNSWVIPAFPAEEDTEFTIVCHKCYADGYRTNADQHWQECGKCGRVFHEETHDYCDLELARKATCTESAAYYEKCGVCGAVDDAHTVPAGDPLGHTWSGTASKTCTVCGVGVFEFDSKNLALESALAFRFKGYLYDEAPADDARMEFRIGNIRTETVFLKDAVRDESGRYVFTCYLNVLELDEKIEAIFRDGDAAVVRQNPLSVTDYLDQVLAIHQGGTEADAKTIGLINAISNYAHYAQLALDISHDSYTVAEDGTYRPTAARSDISLKTAEEFARFETVRTAADGFTAVVSTTRSLVLDDETAIVLYVTPASADYVPDVKVTDKNGRAAGFTCEKQGDGRYKIIIRGIAAHMLADSYTVDVDEGGLTFTNLSALSYAYSTLSSSESEANRAAVSALYDYYLATAAYRAS